MLQHLAQHPPKHELVCNYTSTLPAIEELLPSVSQRFCVRDLYNNFRKKFPGKKLKKLMWQAANATYPNA
ncbi:hypothetical protein A2U01_0069138 [Trifolium medium]|uniref:Uncharacterized protein n=1 Tax=Trifolium medium TaxID=97028 RepID=A0A392SJ56_9FABA|nr:hypothetical protein [Trifolium medium]